jgi:pimeloyl-ACP methyl ester carboxylesterase
MDIVDALSEIRVFDPPRWLRRALAEEARCGSVEVDGATIAWREWGEGGGDRQPLLLVHGFRAHGRWWDPIGPMLAEDRRVVAIDLGGMGDSGRRPSYSRAGFAREIVAVIAAAGLDRPAIAAHSFGGTVALLACALAPDAIGRLIFVDSYLELLDDERGIAGEEEEDAEDAAETGALFPTREAAMRRFRLQPANGWPDPHILVHVARESVLETEEGCRWKFDGRIVATLAAEKLAPPEGIAVPLDLIFGELSTLVPRDRAMLLREMLPGCGDPVGIPWAHHHILLEQPLALVAALRGLLANPR